MTPRWWRPVDGLWRSGKLIIEAYLSLRTFKLCSSKNVLQNTVPFSTEIEGHEYYSPEFLQSGLLPPMMRTLKFRLHEPITIPTLTRPNRSESWKQQKSLTATQASDKFFASGLSLAALHLNFKVESWHPTSIRQRELFFDNNNIANCCGCSVLRVKCALGTTGLSK